MAIISLSHDDGQVEQERDRERHVNALDRFHYPMTAWKARALIIEHRHTQVHAQQQLFSLSHLIAFERR